ncbi:MAG: hypothetical protein Q7J16_09270 [Candidatus Cloacimonadales bacterium]|nr:hypothetical protein [Candidatus Cloacimonadales bacterium]
MLKAKRVIIATICGFVFGFVCMSFASSNPDQPIDLALKLTIIFSRGLTGFMIGISALKITWWLHGIVLGFIGSIPMMFPTMDNPTIMIATVVMGVIYAFLTELITSIIFKAKSAAFVGQ